MAMFKDTFRERGKVFLREKGEKVTVHCHRPEKFLHLERFLVPQKICNNMAMFKDTFRERGKVSCVKKVRK
jgi:hypothetical protein